MNLHNAEFIRSVTSVADCPKDGLVQIAFAGKSNVGKSSVINKLLLRKNFARVGQAPGKTTHINFFCIDKKLYLVDLPGYGYAKVSVQEKERWGKLMEAYFRAEGTLDYGVMIVDARHKPTANDVTMADFFLQSGKPFIVVANKLDKLKKSEIEPNLACIRETLALPEDVAVIPFSAEKGDGREQLLSFVLKAAGELNSSPPQPQSERFGAVIFIACFCEKDLTIRQVSCMITKLFGAYRNLSCDSRYLEWYRSGHNEHDWKSCGRVERPEGSNPSHSAIKKRHAKACLFFMAEYGLLRRPYRLRASSCTHSSFPKTFVSALSQRVRRTHRKSLKPHWFQAFCLQVGVYCTR